MSRIAPTPMDHTRVPVTADTRSVTMTPAAIVRTNSYLCA